MSNPLYFPYKEEVGGWSPSTPTGNGSGLDRRKAEWKLLGDLGRIGGDFRRSYIVRRQSWFASDVATVAVYARVRFGAGGMADRGSDDGHQLRIGEVRFGKPVAVGSRVSARAVAEAVALHGSALNVAAHGYRGRGSRRTRGYGEVDWECVISGLTILLAKV